MADIEDLPDAAIAMEVDGLFSPQCASKEEDTSSRQLAKTSVLRAELHAAVNELSACGLASATQWAAELFASLPEISDEELADANDVKVPSVAQHDKSECSWKLQASLMVARAHFAMREYGRAAQSLHGFQGLHRCPAALFLKNFSLYLAGEKRREEEAAEVAGQTDRNQVKNSELSSIEEHLAALHQQGLLDGLNLYVYGIVLRGMEMKVEARQILVQSVTAFPWNWSAWLDILAICSDLNDVATVRAELNVPDHWMSSFFWAAFNMEMQLNGTAKELYAKLKISFPDSSYILSQIATCQYIMQNFDDSQALFVELRNRDPFKLASLDTYSNILYVKEQSAGLSHLARQAVKIDKYAPETCCIIGNYYSLKGEHEKSVAYFQRALNLNRSFTPAWILMGHEFMEMRNAPAAIDAYRTAVNINQRDYRAWYGLGQTYELLNLHFYALFYYRRAMMLRPDDARMWCAMAQCYDFMERKTEALKCYEKAHRCGDRERMALPRLARLHQDLGDRRQAASYYGQLLAQSTPGSWCPKASGGGLSTEVVEALKFLMVFYKEEGKLTECEACASKLLDTGGPEKDEAKAMLQELRSSTEGRQVLQQRPPLGVVAPDSIRGQRRLGFSGMSFFEQPET